MRHPVTPLRRVSLAMTVFKSQQEWTVCALTVCAAIDPYSIQRTAATCSLRSLSRDIHSERLQLTLSACVRAVLSDSYPVSGQSFSVRSVPADVGPMLGASYALRPTVEVFVRVAADSLLRRLQHEPDRIELSNECADYLCLASESWLLTLTEDPCGNKKSGRPSAAL